MNPAIAFDMDGVLIDSQPLHYELDMQVLRDAGYPAKLSTVTPYTGMSNPDRWPKYKKDLSLQVTPERLIEMAEQAMRDLFTKADLTAIDGIPALLQKIKEAGICCGVASSSSHELIILVLEKIGVKQYFNFIVSGEDVTKGKPAPDIYMKAAEKANTAPKRCIAIEDAPAGILAAKNAGLKCIAYRNPSTIGQEFTNADYVIDKFSECFPIIEEFLHE